MVTDYAALTGGVTGMAVFSNDRAWRYRLGRRWRPGPTLAWVCLNPSTADAMRGDMTLRKIETITRRHGYGALDLVNLSAFRSRDPRALIAAGAPADDWHAGDFADQEIIAAIGGAAAVVAAWGAWGGHPLLAARARAIRFRLARCGRPVYRLGLTANGQPRHPCRLPNAAALMRWESDL